MRWITRERIRVGRIGCAWLITRFIDPEAELYFVPGPQLSDEAERLGAIAFHVEGSALARQGDRSSFEVMLQRYELTSDPALALLGRIVNTADIRQSPYRQPEGPGLKAITEGLLLVHTDDHALCAAGGQVYDALYAYCQEQVRRGRFPSAPAESVEG
jgi:hypothetical protein